MNLKKHRRKAEINIVPLIDVLIVLIFFFIMSMQFRDMNVLSITPPEMETAGKSTNTEQVTIGITPEGEFYVNNEVRTEEEIPAIFADAAAQDPKPAILIMADEEVPLKYVTFIMDQSRKVKMDKVRLQTR